METTLETLPETTEITQAATSREPAKLVRCYYLGDYERNGYDDSDFFVTYWDDVNGKVESKEYSSTRYGGGWNYSAELIRQIPADVAQRLRSYLYARALDSAIQAERARVFEPQPESLGHGVSVRFLKDSSKRSKTPWKAGETGECFWQGWYGTFYGNGYNKRTRFNGRLGVRMADGRKVFCPMEAVRLNCEPDEAACLRHALEVANNTQLCCPGAWWTNCATIPGSFSL